MSELQKSLRPQIRKIREIATRSSILYFQLSLEDGAIKLKYFLKEPPTWPYRFSFWTHSTLVWGISVINDGLMCLVDVSSMSVRCFKLVHIFLKQNCGQMLFRITRWTLNPKQVMSKGRRGKKKGEGRGGGKILLKFLCSCLHSHGYSTDLQTIYSSVDLQGLIWMPEIYQNTIV